MNEPPNRPPYDVFADRPIDGDEIGERMGETDDAKEEDVPLVPKELP